MGHEYGGRPQNRLGIGKLNIKKPGFYSDGGNLYLRVDKSDDGVLRRSWIFRYKLRGSDRERDMGLGRVGVRSRGRENWQRTIANWSRPASIRLSIVARPKLKS